MFRFVQRLTPCDPQPHEIQAEPCENEDMLLEFKNQSTPLPNLPISKPSNILELLESGAEWAHVPSQTFSNAGLFIDPKKPQQRGLLYSRFAFKAIQHLVQMIVDEYWGTKLSLLKKYLNDTFVRLSREEKLLQYKRKEANFHILLWNTGLLTKQHEFVYCIMIPHVPLKDSPRAGDNTNNKDGESGSEEGEDEFLLHHHHPQQQQQQGDSYSSLLSSQVLQTVNTQPASHHIKGFFPDHKVPSVVQAMVLERLQDVRNFSEVTTPFPKPPNYIHEIHRDMLIFNPCVPIDSDIQGSSLLGPTPLHEEYRRSLLPSIYKDLSSNELAVRVKAALPITMKRLLHNSRTSVPCVRVNSLGYVEATLLAPIHLDKSEETELAISLVLQQFTYPQVYKIQELIPCVEAYEMARIFSSVDQTWLLKPLPPHPKILKAQEKTLQQSAAAAAAPTPKLSPREGAVVAIMQKSPRDSMNRPKMTLNLQPESIDRGGISFTTPNSARRK